MSRLRLGTAPDSWGVWFADDPAQLTASRKRVLAIANTIIPGHGPAFEPRDTTPR